jgi:hypothetical protein
MTVKKLITILEEMPQDAKIRVEMLAYNFKGTIVPTVSEINDVYEGIENNVVIQGFEF